MCTCKHDRSPWLPLSPIMPVNHVKDQSIYFKSGTSPISTNQLPHIHEHKHTHAHIYSCLISICQRSHTHSHTHKPHIAICHAYTHARIETPTTCLISMNTHIHTFLSNLNCQHTHTQSYPQTLHGNMPADTLTHNETPTTRLISMNTHTYTQIKTSIFESHNALRTHTHTAMPLNPFIHTQSWPQTPIKSITSTPLHCRWCAVVQLLLTNQNRPFKVIEWLSHTTYRHRRM